jgi:hypothetical protein
MLSFLQTAAIVTTVATAIVVVAQLSSCSANLLSMSSSATITIMPKAATARVMRPHAAFIVSWSQQLLLMVHWYVQYPLVSIRFCLLPAMLQHGLNSTRPRLAPHGNKTIKHHSYWKSQSVSAASHRSLCHLLIPLSLPFV